MDVPYYRKYSTVVAATVTAAAAVPAVIVPAAIVETMEYSLLLTHLFPNEIFRCLMFRSGCRRRRRSRRRCSKITRRCFFVALLFLFMFILPTTTAQFGQNDALFVLPEQFSSLSRRFTAFLFAVK